MGCCCAKRDADGRPLTRWFPEFEAGLPSLKGKRIAITGTTSGTGYMAALTCARKGAEVIMLNRDSERATAAELRLKGAVPSGMFVTISCDLQSFKSVHSVRAAFESRFGTGAGLDVLACNAGIMSFPDRATPDGFDVQMHTNYLSHFLLVKELLPALKVAAAQNGEARIIQQTSGARCGKPLDAKFLGKNGGALGGDGMGACFERYHQSKLAQAVFTYALDQRLTQAGIGIKAVFCTPGVADTDLFINLEKGGTKAGCLKCVMDCLFGHVQQSQADGTMPLMQCIAGAETQSGDLWTPSQGPSNQENGPPRVHRRPLTDKKEAVCTDPSAWDLLWAESEKATEETFKI